MTAWRQTWVRPFLLPAGVVFGAGYLLLDAGWVHLPVSTVNYYVYAIALTGLLLAWRFHASRVFGAIGMLLLAHRAIEFFANGHPAQAGPGLTALEAISFLVPLNLVVLAYSRERGFTLDSWAPKLLVLFLDAVFVAVISRPVPAPGSELFHGAIVSRAWSGWTRVPQISLLMAAVTMALLVGRFVRTRHPVDAAFAWCVISVVTGLGSGGVGVRASGLFGAACLILAISVLESSYRMAYYDELTGIPGRRAFNGALMQLPEVYAVAVVDIDHFKSFNDTYGHETGDDVLRLVAKKLAGVTGGGSAFRVGGEEFNILFAGKSAEECREHLELLRANIEASPFRLRGSERRAEARGPERRRPAPKKTRRTPAVTSARSETGELSETVSIGFAERKQQCAHPEAVIAAADRALYAAKENGRNRLEVAGAASRKHKSTRKKKASANIA